MHFEFDFFISHSKELKFTVAIPLTQVLTSLGFKVWIDRKELSAGEYIYDNIKKAIAQSTYCIAVIDSTYLTRDWTKEELRLFHEKNLASPDIVPIFWGIEKEEAFLYFPWMNGIAFEKGDNSNLDKRKIVEIVCRITGRFFSDRTKSTLDDALFGLSEHDFPCKKTLLILIHARQYYSNEFRIASLELCNLIGFIYAIYCSLESQKCHTIDTAFNFSCLLRDFCFDLTSPITYNMYLSLQKAVIVSVEELTKFLDRR